MVVVQPEAAMAAVPGEGEVAWANKFACFAHGVILP